MKETITSFLKEQQIQQYFQAPVDNELTAELISLQAIFEKFYKQGFVLNPQEKLLYIETLRVWVF